jgi:hypothetical protein
MLVVYCRLGTQSILPNVEKMGEEKKKIEESHQDTKLYTVVASQCLNSNTYQLSLS